MNYLADLEEGLKLIDTQQFEAAFKVASKLQEIAPDAADGYHLAAIACQYEMRWEDSIHFLDEAIARAEEHSQLFNLRAFALMCLQRYEEAENDLQVSIGFEDNPTAHRNMGMLKILRGEIAEGLNYLMDRIHAEPNDPYNWVIMGDLIIGEGMQEKAISYYQKALSINPDDPYLRQLNATAIAE